MRARDEPRYANGRRLLGRAIRRARWQADLTQEALGARAGLSQSAISRIETGTVNGLRYASFIRVLDGLRCSDLRVEVAKTGVAELADRQRRPDDAS